MLHEAVRGGANAWMAYDWVYPPPKGGESLIHLNWVADYRLTKIYHLFRQWSLAVPWDSQVLEVDRTARVLANAFLAPQGRALIVQVLNPEREPLPLRLRVRPAFNSPLAKRLRTSPAEDCAELPGLPFQGSLLGDTLPAKSLTTYRLEGR